MYRASASWIPSEDTYPTAEHRPLPPGSKLCLWRRNQTSITWFKAAKVKSTHLERQLSDRRKCWKDAPEGYYHQVSKKVLLRWPYPSHPPASASHVGPFLAVGGFCFSFPAFSSEAKKTELNWVFFGSSELTQKLKYLVTVSGNGGAYIWAGRSRRLSMYVYMYRI